MSRSRPGAGGFALLLLFILYPELAFAARAVGEIPQVPALMPDASQAQINGRTAIGLWASRDGRLLGPQGYTAHFVDDRRLEEQLVFPAGHWLLPRAGTYKIWIEGNGFISPTFSLLRYSAGPFRGRGFASVNEVVEAGQVKLPPGLELRPNESVRVLQIGPRASEGVDRGFMRAITAGGDRSVLMPSGRAVALLYDTTAGEYLAASPPFEVPAQASVVIPSLKSPENGVVFAVVRRHAPGEGNEISVTLTEAAPTGSRPPDALEITWEWIYALWYNVGGSRTEIEALSAAGVLPPRDVGLEPGRVTTFRVSMDPALDLGASPAPDRAGPE